MCSLKSFVIVALIYALSVSSQNAGDQKARLLVSKQVLNKLLVQDSDILVKVCIHKIFNKLFVESYIFIHFYSIPFTTWEVYQPQMLYYKI